VNGVYTYSVDTPITCSGLHGFAVRVRAHHPNMPVPFLSGLITWAGGPPLACAAAS
jgi:glycogen phosphorylase